MSPTQCRTRVREVVGRRLVVLFGVEGAVFADRVVQHQREGGMRIAAELAELMNGRGGPRLVVLADRAVGFFQQLVGRSAVNVLQMLVGWVRIPGQKFAAACAPVVCDLVCAEN